jgi:F-type H+-transporting ATPase subunit gamma
MSTLKALRSRIKTVESTQKITSAMKMVAAARLRRLQDRLDATRAYAKDIEHLSRRVFTALQKLGESILPPPKPNATELLIVFTASRGLCGSYNTNLIRQARQECERLQNSGQAFELICIGKRGRDSLTKLYPNNIAPWTLQLDLSEDANHEATTQIADNIFTNLNEGNYKSITLICGHFRNVLTQNVEIKPLWPLAHEVEESVHAELITEPSIEVLSPHVLNYYLSALVFQAWVENNTCEQAARMTAMDNATRNAHDMISSLKLVYNRTRQAKITTELIEIISGAQALEG